MIDRPSTFRILVCAILVIAAVSVGACGRRGSLDPPVEARADGTAKSAEAATPGKDSAAGEKPHEPFILDGLIR